MLLSIRYKTFFKPSQISIKVHLQQINQKHESPSQMKKKWYKNYTKSLWQSPRLWSMDSNSTTPLNIWIFKIRVYRILDSLKVMIAKKPVNKIRIFIINDIHKYIQWIWTFRKMAFISSFHCKSTYRYTNIVFIYSFTNQFCKGHL